MLNGAPMKLRKAQASSATASKKRISAPAVSFFSRFAGFAPERLRRESSGAIANACFRPDTPGQAGVANGCLRIMCGGDGANVDQAARRAVRQGARPARQAELRSFRTLFRLVEDSPGPGDHQ